MKTIGCIIARTNSKRLPKKVLIDINNRKLIEHIIDNLKRSQNLDGIYLCTSVDKNDEILLEIAKSNKIDFYAGSRESVLDRMLYVAEIENAVNVVRITGDNIFTDIIFLDKMIEEHNKHNMEYTRTGYLPLGVTSEVISVEALKRCYKNIDPNKSEYLTVYMFAPQDYKCLILMPPKKLQKPFFTLTVDTPEDLERTTFIMDRLYNGNTQVYLDEIINLHLRVGIPFISINRQEEIKLPDGQKISYEDYRGDLDQKVKNSKIIQLQEDFYEQNKD